MRTTIFGSGGVGGYFGARLAQAGHDVQFIARGEHRRAMETHGLRLRSILGDAHINPATVAETPSADFQPDLVLMCVKTWQLEDAARALTPALQENTIVMPLLNGVEASDQLSHIVGKQHVMPGLCGIMAFIEEPGVIRHAAVRPFLKFGELDNQPSARADELLQVFTAAEHIDAEVPDDIHAALWMKFLFVASTGAVGAITRAPMGVVRDLPETRELLSAVMSEILALAAATGVALRPEAVDKTLKMVDGLPAAGTVSMQRDLMQGRPSELEEQVGTIVRLGRQANVATPMSRFIYAALLAGERQARGELTFPG